MDRALTPAEAQLLRWLLEHGEPTAAGLIPSIAYLVAIECPCGCANLDFPVEGQIDSESETKIVADFLWESKSGAQNGIFVFTKNDQLAGMEVWSCDGVEIPGLPNINQLRPIPK